MIRLIHAPSSRVPRCKRDRPMMKIPMTALFLALCSFLLASNRAVAEKAPDGAGAPAKGASSAGGTEHARSSVVTRMMAFDKNHDGKLTREEITDARLLRLFEQADANSDGVVTEEELTALAAKLD